MRRVISILALFVCLSATLILPATSVHAADPGDAGPASAGIAPGLAPQSTVDSIQITFAQEYGKTSIFLRVCGNGPYFQLRAEDVGQWFTEVFLKTQASGGCSPSTSLWWRMVYNADPGPELFRIYATNNDTALSEGDFMQRAARYACHVTGYGTGSCTREPVSVPDIDINDPSEGQTVQGAITLRGWAIDLASLNGTGVSDAHVYLNGAFLGAAGYGQPRGDVSATFGDSRFTNSGYTFALDTNTLPNGLNTLAISYRSALSGQWSSMQRQFNIDNGALNQPPRTPIPAAPANGGSVSGRTVTLSWQDAGDPDNGPHSSRTYDVSIRKVDGSWGLGVSQSSPSWAVTVPNDGVYFWKVRAYDGAAYSGWSQEWSFTVPTPPAGRTLDVRYVDQVYVQQTPEGGYWNDCGPSSTAMVLHYEGKETRDVLYNRQATLDLVCRVKANCRGGANLGLIMNAMKQRGLAITSTTNPSLATIRQSIDRGHPMLMSISGRDHIAVAVGYGDGNTVVINDPFGGKNWWNVLDQRNDRSNGRWISRPSTPQLKGQNVSYTYGSELSANYGVIVNGPAPLLHSTLASISRTLGGALTGEGARFDFPGSASLAAQSSDTLTVTHTPQLAPTQDIGDYVAALASFRIGAVDDAGQPVSQFDRAFTITVDLDPTIVDAWGIGGGQTPSLPTAAQQNGVMSAWGQTKQDLARSLIVAAWDATAQKWTPLPTAADLANYRVTAKSASFTEFAVFVKSQHILYLPLIER